MGIRDGANLAWRLALVLAGQADPSLLDDYTTERRAPCKFLIVGFELLFYDCSMAEIGVPGPRSASRQDHLRFFR